MIGPEQLNGLRKIGLSGWDFFNDPQDVDDRALTDVLNISYDRGYPRPRNGSVLKWSAPSGETNAPLALLGARTSDGINYAIAIYAPNFYLRDEVNNQWIKINQSYTPSSSYISLMYSYINWNAGRAADSLYSCNGTESMIKWPVCLSYFAGAQVAGDGTITLTDGSYFPNSGTLVIKNAGVEFTKAYTARAGNVLTLTGTLGQDVAAGSAVCLEISEKAAMPKGKVMTRYQRRFFVANYVGGETAIKYSVTQTPEDFTTGTGADSGGALILSDGNGEITKMDSFGEYILVSKKDSLHRLNLVISGDLSAKLDQIIPVVGEIRMGPVNTWASVKKNNAIYYPTVTEGIYEINPDTTGTNTSVSVNIISQNIQKYVLTLNFDNARTVSVFQKLFISCASVNSSGVASSFNDVVLVYDFLRKVWTRYNNWNVKDWLVHNYKLYFISAADSNIYEADFNYKVDNDASYECFVKTKRYDMGNGTLPKSVSKIFVQGYISQVTNLYVDVMFNEGGSQNTTTYLISGTGRYVTQQFNASLGLVLGGAQIMGTGQDIEDDIDELGIFRVYLDTPSRYGFYNVQLKFYTIQAGADWAITGLGFLQLLEQKAPGALSIGPLNS